MTAPEFNYLTMSADDYHAYSAIGSSQLKYAMQSLAKFQANLLSPLKKESESMELGTCAHAAILERDFKKYMAGPDAARNTKEWKEFVAANPGRIILKPDIYSKVRDMYHEFYDHELAPKMIHNGVAEATFVSRIHGYHYKARPDYLVQTDSDVYMVDYKTCRSAKYEDFQKAILDYGYDISAAHYIRVFFESTGIKVSEYYWIAQETEAPYEICIYRMDDECRTLAAKTVSTLYENIAWGLKHDQWPKRYPADIFDIDLPTWAIDRGARNVTKLTDDSE